jgi:hypothetical protein
MLFTMPEIMIKMIVVGWAKAQRCPPLFHFNGG